MSSLEFFFFQMFQWIKELINKCHYSSHADTSNIGISVEIKYMGMGREYILEFILWYSNWPKKIRETFFLSRNQKFRKAKMFIYIISIIFYDFLIMNQRITENLQNCKRNYAFFIVCKENWVFHMAFQLIFQSFNIQYSVEN